MIECPICKKKLYSISSGKAFKCRCNFCGIVWQNSGLKEYYKSRALETDTDSEFILLDKFNPSRRDHLI